MSDRRRACVLALLGALVACSGGVNLGSADGGMREDAGEDDKTFPARPDAGSRVDAACDPLELPTCPEVCSGATTGVSCTTPNARCRQYPSASGPEDCTCAQGTWSCRPVPDPPSGCAVDCVDPGPGPRPDEPIPDASADS